MTRLSLASEMLLGAVALWSGTLQAQESVEAEVRAVIQAQADAFNSGDLDATMATLSSEVDWRTIGRELIDGPDAVRAAMRGWIDGQHANEARLVYPADSILVRVHSRNEAVADVVLIWEDARLGPAPKREATVENLFFVFRREAGELVIRHVRNTTTAPPQRAREGAPQR